MKPISIDISQNCFWFCIRKYYKILHMDNCNICDGNAVISKCKTCLIKCCKGCFERHKHSCNILKEVKYHECQYHAELVKAYCCKCCQLICKECVVDNHVNHNSISLLEAYHNRNDIVKEFIWKQPMVSKYIGACNETRKKYCILQAQIKEEEHDFQRCIGSVRDSLLQQVEPNIKQIDDHCKAGHAVLELQKSSTEHTRQSQKFALIYLAQLSRYRNGLNAFEKHYMNCNILANPRIIQSREDVHQVFLSKVV